MTERAWRLSSESASNQETARRIEHARGHSPRVVSPLEIILGKCGFAKRAGRCEIRHGVFTDCTRLCDCTEYMRSQVVELTE